jgi:hypothetical protein
LDAGRVLLVDFGREPAGVQQIDVLGQELAEARDALEDDPVTFEESRRQLQEVIEGLTARNETVRVFVGDARDSPLPR